MNIKIDQNKNIVSYVRYENLHEKEFKQLKKYINKNTKNIIVNHVKDNSVNSFLSKVYEFEKSKEYNYQNNKKNSIYAVSLEILLPQYITTLQQKRKLINWYIRYLLADLKIYLNYFVYELKKGRGTYLKFIIFEREYINSEVYERYNKNYYTHFYDENGIKQKKIKIEKGTVKKDEQGNKIKKFVLFGNKMRLLNEASFSYLIHRCKQILADAYKRITQQKIEFTLRFKRRYGYKTMHKLKRKVIQIINQCKTTIENKLNEQYTQLYKQLDNFDDRYYKYSSEQLKIRKLYRLFSKIEHIFEKNEFVYNGEKYRINYRYVNLVELKESIQNLMEYFEEEYQKIS